MSIRLGRDPANQATIEDKDGRGGLAIFVSQSPECTARYKVTVKAKVDEGLFEVGEFILRGPGNPLPNTPFVDQLNLTRCVAVASCPGARDWTVAFEPLPDPGGNFATDNGTVSLSVGWPVGPPGLTLLGERYNYYTGVDGAVTLEQGDRVVGWTAWAEDPGATVEIAGGDPIPIPGPGAMSGSCGESLTGLTTFIFTNTSGYLIETLRSG